MDIRIIHNDCLFFIIDTFNEECIRSFKLLAKNVFHSILMFLMKYANVYLSYS